VLSQALGGKIKPVLMVNKIDRGIFELQVNGEEMHQQFIKVVENVNVIVSTYECEDLGESQEIDPVMGTAAFGSTLFGWAFTCTDFAKVYSKKLGVDRDKMQEKLWGDNYFDQKAKKWKTDDKAVDPLQGGFVQRDQMHKRWKTMAYEMHKSDSNKILSKASSKLTYGPAKL
jgi:elongation factor 2